ncbi:MAG: 50S ribosomal protein L4 [candidate division WOR-3 bacterium]|nr:50S ribosomal protein L4 [candidate division WOR-3 bacterium]MDW8150881.1 50S ribosomal protein L4 [candidate division WOR-3 bacterium]
MKALVYNLNGENIGEYELPSSIFDVEINEHLIWEVIKMYQANQRQGTHSAKNRSEVKGSRRKIWAQKHTGRARHGDRYAPIFVGGGQAHAVKPRDYYYRLPKKALKQALKMALSDRARENKILIFENFQLKEIKTRNVYQLLKKINLVGNRIVFVPSAYNKELYLSARNIEKVSIRPAVVLNTLDVISSDFVLLEKEAIDGLLKRLGG